MGRQDYPHVLGSMPGVQYFNATKDSQLMTTVFINSNEPREIAEAFGDSAIVTPLPGFDFLLYTTSGPVAIERKSVPGDLLASISDGRLARELKAMREESKHQILLLGPGELIFDKDGHLLNGRVRTMWTKAGLYNLLRTIRYVEGIDIEPPIGYARTIDDMVLTVDQIQEYFDKKNHLSMKSRPGLQTEWLAPIYEERVRYFYQGIPGISAIRARELESKFRSPIDLYNASYEDIQSIPKFGQVISTKIYNFLHKSKAECESEVSNKSKKAK